MSQPLPHLTFLSEDVVLLQFGSEISVDMTRVIQHWFEALHGDRAVSALVPTYCDIALTVSDFSRWWDLSDWQQYLFGFAHAETSVERKVVDISVCFESMATELEAYARTVRMSPAEVIDTILGADFCVGMLGFLPGMPYLIGLPESLHCPRRIDLIKAPANTLAIGGKQIGVLPNETITGWWPIAQVAERFFEISRHPMNRLQVGDSVRFLKS